MDTRTETESPRRRLGSSGTKLKPSPLYNVICIWQLRADFDCCAVSILLASPLSGLPRWCNPPPPPPSTPPSPHLNPHSYDAPPTAPGTAKEACFDSWTPPQWKSIVQFHRNSALGGNSLINVTSGIVYLSNFQLTPLSLAGRCLSESIDEQIWKWDPFEKFEKTYWGKLECIRSVMDGLRWKGYRFRKSKHLNKMFRGVCPWSLLALRKRSFKPLYTRPNLFVPAVHLGQAAKGHIDSSGLKKWFWTSRSKVKKFGSKESQAWSLGFFENWFQASVTFERPKSLFNTIFCRAAFFHPRPWWVVYLGVPKKTLFFKIELSSLNHPCHWVIGGHKKFQRYIWICGLDYSISKYF